MEVDQHQFHPKLSDILTNIANASFISIDLEMSGISMRLPGISNDKDRASGKTTLQQHYEETKGAAEKYQILQIGITCVQEGDEFNSYVARPYNFSVSPLFIYDDRLGMNRDFTFSTAAVKFLINNSFDVGKIFIAAVPYLSRVEELTARNAFDQKEDKSSTNRDIVLSPTDHEAKGLLKYARETIGEWIEKKELDHVNISRHGGLNAYQRRLIHQLIRDEFPALTTFSQCGGTFMQVQKTNHEHEIQRAAWRRVAFEERLAKQIGLRYIIESLMEGDHLDKIDPRWSCKNDTGAPKLISLEKKKQEIDDIQFALKNKKRIIVGHNLFTDLVFIYRMFIAPLPDTVEEFQDRIHELFPYIIDTKYLATRNRGSMQTNSSLKDVHDGLESQRLPSISLHREHESYKHDEKNFNSYEIHDKLHEAGYDSWITAQVFVKLSAKLKASEDYSSIGDSTDEDVGYVTANEKFDSDGSDESSWDSPDETLSTQLMPRSKMLNTSIGGFKRNKIEQTPTRSPQRTLTPEKASIPRTIHTPQKTSISQRTPTSHRTLTSSRFATYNPYSGLPVEGLSEPLSVKTSSESDLRKGCSESDSTGSHLEFDANESESSLMDEDVDENFRASSAATLHTEIREPSTKDITPKFSDLQIDVGTDCHINALNLTAQVRPGEKKINNRIPHFNARFWNRYKNRLRVYGTESEMCRLG